MKKIRRFLQVVLFINFMVGLHDGMRAGNLAAILVNGVLVLAVIASEKEEKYEARDENIQNGRCREDRGNAGRRQNSRG